MQRAAITLGRGKYEAHGDVAELGNDVVTSIAELLSEHTGVEAWWSGGVFRDNHRTNETWIAQQIIGIDVDHHDPLGQHAPLSPEASQLLRQQLPLAPSTWQHPTPRGARLIFVLDEPVIDERLFPMAWQWCREQALSWLPNLEVGSLRIDPSCKDLARFFWAPLATVGGIARGC